MLEHGAYTLLLDRYYTTERPIANRAEAYRFCRARSAAERQAVDAVLDEFFVSDGEAFMNRRAEEELAKALHQRTVNQEIGKRGGRPRKTDSVSVGIPNANQNETESEPNRNPSHKPLATTNTSEAKASAASQPDPSQPDPIFGDGLAYLVSCGDTERGARSFLGKMRNVVGDLVTTELLAEAQRHHVSDPKPWLRKAAERRTSTGRQGNSGVCL